MIKEVLSKIGLVILLCAFGWVVYNQNEEVKKQKDKAQAMEQTINDLDQQIKYAEIKLDDSISLYQAKVQDLVFSQKNIQAKYDKLLKASSLKPKDIEKVTEVVTKIEYRDTVIAVVDSFGGMRASVADDFVSIEVQVDPELKAVFDYEIRDSLVILNVQEKKSILFGLIKWKKHKETRVVSKNPKAKIVGLQTANVIE